MAWYNPASWFTPKEKVTATTTTKPVYSATFDTPESPEQPVIKEVQPAQTTKDYVWKTERGYKFSSGGSPPPTAPPPTDASLTIGGSTYNAATGVSVQQLPPSFDQGKPYEYNAATGRFENVKQKQEPAPLTISKYRPEDFDREKNIENKWMNRPFRRKRGTLAPGEDPYLTYLDQQREIDIAKSVEISGVTSAARTEVNLFRENLQYEVDVGNMRTEEAQKQLDVKISEVNVQLNKDVKGTYSKYEELKDPSKPNIPLLTGTGFYGLSKIAGKAGGSLAFGAMGVYYLSKGLKATQETGGYYEGWGGTETTYYNNTWTAPPKTWGFIGADKPQFDLSREGYIAGGIGIAAGVAYGAGQIGSIEKSIVAGQIGAKPKFDYSKAEIIKGEGGQLDFVKVTGYSDSGLKTTVRAYGKTIVTPEGEFFTPVGYGTSETTGQVWNIRRAGSGVTKYYGTSTFEYGTKGWTSQVDDFIYSFGRTTVEPQVQFSTVYSTPGEFTKYGGFKFYEPSLTGAQISASKKAGTDIFGNQQYATAGYKSTQGKVSPFIGKTTVYEQPDLQVSGFEKADDVSQFFTTRGSTKTAFSKTFGDGSEVVNVYDTSFVPPSNIADFASKTSQIGGTTTATTTTGTPIVITGADQVQTDVTTKTVKVGSGGGITSPTVTDLDTTRVRVGGGTITTPTTRFGSGSEFRLGSGTIQGTVQKPKQIQEQESVTSLGISPPSTGGFGFSTPAPIKPIIPPFWLPKLRGTLGFPTSKIYKGKQRFKYTPDYPSLVFGTTGKAPKGIATGLKSRPIPRGFSFAFKSPEIKIGNLFGTKRKRRKK